MPRFFAIFFSASGHNQWIVLLCLVLGGAAQAVGFAVLVPLLQVAENGVDTGGSPINAIIIQALAQVGLEPSLVILMTIAVAGMVLKAGFVILAMTYVGYAVAEVATGLRTRLIDALVKVKWSYFVHQPLGGIANAISLEAHRSANAYAMVAQVLNHGILSVFYIAIAFAVSWKLAVVSIVLGGLMIVMLTTFVRIAQRAGHKQTRYTSALLTNLSDMLIGIKPLKAMARDNRFTYLFDGQIKSLKKALRKQVISKQILKNLEEPLIALSLGIGFVGAKFYWNTPLSELIVFGLLIGQTISSISKVMQQLQQAVIEESAYYAVHDMIKDVESQAEMVFTGLTPTLLQGCTLQGVSFSYGNQQVLDRLSLDIPAGELTVITGNSGAGKTTITDLLIGLLHPSEGRILIDGAPLRELNMEAWRRMVGYVPQELILFHDTIGSNITLGDPSFTDDDIREALQSAGAWEFVKDLSDGIKTVVGERGMRMSGGQRQRIALARALVHKPKLLILDEVTSALDPETEENICQNVRSSIAHSKGALTVLAITHRPAWLKSADRVYQLGDGGVTSSAA